MKRQPASLRQSNRAACFVSFLGMCEIILLCKKSNIKYMQLSPIIHIDCCSAWWQKVQWTTGLGLFSLSVFEQPNLGNRCGVWAALLKCFMKRHKKHLWSVISRKVQRASGCKRIPTARERSELHHQKLIQKEKRSEKKWARSHTDKKENSPRRVCVKCKELLQWVPDAESPLRLVFGWTHLPGSFGSGWFLAAAPALTPAPVKSPWQPAGTGSHLRG